jgi:hypothetical protein
VEEFPYGYRASPGSSGYEEDVRNKFGGERFLQPSLSSCFRPVEAVGSESLVFRRSVSS